MESVRVGTRPFASRITYYGNSRMRKDGIMVSCLTFYVTFLKLTVYAKVQQSLKKSQNTADLIQHAGWPTFTLISTMK